MPVAIMPWTDPDHVIITDRADQLPIPIATIRSGPGHEAIMAGTGASNSAEPAGTAFRPVGICREEVVIKMSFVSSERTGTLKPTPRKSLEQKANINRFSSIGTVMFRHSARKHGACRYRCRKADQPKDQIRHDVAALKHFLSRTVTDWLIETFVPI